MKPKPKKKKGYTTRKTNAKLCIISKSFEKKKTMQKRNSLMQQRGLNIIHNKIKQPKN